jgi:predicted RNA-binding Zn-ribbon protein involved in translation (DUF1610 family)
MIEWILSVIFGVIAFGAASMIPSETMIQNNQAGGYKSKQMFIYIAGIAALIGGVIILIMSIMDDTIGEIIILVQMGFLMIIGIGLVARNNQKSKFLAQCEAAGYPGAAVPGVVAPQVVPGMQPGVQPQAQGQYVAAQQVGVKQMPQQVVAQQIGVKPMPQQQTVSPTQVAPQYVQPQQQTAQKVAVQQPVAAQPQAAQKPRIIVINCPKCKGKMQIDTRMLGQKMKCPHCGVEGKIG